MDMDRRQFIQSAGTVTAASLVSTTSFGNDQTRRTSNPDATHSKKTGSWFDPTLSWHFFDLWPFDHIDNLHLRQGQAQWQPDATFVEAPIGNLAAWPTVYRDKPTGKWRMLYSADWKPYKLMIAESDDGRQWRPLPQPSIKPEGGKVASHHVFTLPSGSGGGVYLDPVAADEFPFKVFVHHQGKPAYERALADPRHRWHKLARQAGEKRYMNDEFTLVSEDGVHWEPRFDMA